MKSLKSQPTHTLTKANKPTIKLSNTDGLKKLTDILSVKYGLEMFLVWPSLPRTAAY